MGSVKKHILEDDTLQFIFHISSVFGIFLRDFSTVPEDTGGIWNCNPPIIMGYPVHVGTRCNFICNGMIFGEYICSNLGKWNEDPNERTCENGEPTSTSTVI